jgi:hypothetical protein
MTSPENVQPPPRKLRLWPGIIIVVLLFVSRFGVKAVIPGRLRNGHDGLIRFRDPLSLVVGLF